jgi:hypothetical protein
LHCAAKCLRLRLCSFAICLHVSYYVKHCIIAVL